MIDNAVIIFSTLMAVVTIVRAVRVDAFTPWFPKTVRVNPKRSRTLR